MSGSGNGSVLQFTRKEYPRTGSPMTQAWAVLNSAAATQQAMERYSKLTGNSNMKTSYPPSNQASRNAALYARFMKEFMELNKMEIQENTFTGEEENRMKFLAKKLSEMRPKKNGASRKGRKGKGRRSTRKNRKTRRVGK
jgi:hypothetical protein